MNNNLQGVVWDWLHSVLEFFFSQELMQSNLFTQIISPMFDLLFGTFMLYFFLIKPLNYIFGLIGDLPKRW